ncbi:unnamed protein product [Cyclocybe aegerita]|uniref:Uncharacterized protein n=1 Tax=Cyclocybe aegerita TaxID=1973307 RepID=A0A8S0XQ30_CYCAE|nr:unnamed protein product [Cyclocybe aegerita]
MVSMMRFWATRKQKVTERTCCTRFGPDIANHLSRGGNTGMIGGVSSALDDMRDRGVERVEMSGYGTCGLRRYCGLRWIFRATSRSLARHFGNIMFIHRGPRFSFPGLCIYWQGKPLEDKSRKPFHAKTMCASYVQTQFRVLSLFFCISGRCWNQLPPTTSHWQLQRQ